MGEWHFDDSQVAGTISRPDFYDSMYKVASHVRDWGPQLCMVMESRPLAIRNSLEGHPPSWRWLRLSLGGGGSRLGLDQDGSCRVQLLTSRLQSAVP